MRFSYTRQVLCGLLFVAIAGVLFHFVYDWSGQNPVVGLFFPVNESTWEHMKLMYLPMVLWTIWLAVCEQRREEKYKEMWRWMLNLQCLAILVGTWLIPVLFYSYRGILGFGVFWMDIATFFVAEFIVGWKMIWKYSHLMPIWRGVGICARVLVIVQGVAFMWYSYHPMMFGIFEVP